jgi:hypothetical protein
MRGLLRFVRQQWIWWLPLLAAVTAWATFRATSRQKRSTGYTVSNHVSPAPDLREEYRDAAGARLG